MPGAHAVTPEMSPGAPEMMTLMPILLPFPPRPSRPPAPPPRAAHLLSGAACLGAAGHQLSPENGRQVATWTNRGPPELHQDVRVSPGHPSPISIIGGMFRGSGMGVLTNVYFFTFLLIPLPSFTIELT